MSAQSDLDELPTCQQMADFYQRQVETGRGDWKTGINGKMLICPGRMCMYTGFRLPVKEYMYDEKNKVVLLTPQIGDTWIPQRF